MNKVLSGIAALVFKDGLVFSGVRKNTTHGSGRRALPGGHCELQDETFADVTNRECDEEMGIVVKVREFRGGWDFFSTLRIVSEDGQHRYSTTYTVADYVFGGEWLDDRTLKGRELDKFEKWELTTLDELFKLALADGPQMWIPVDRIKLLRKELGA